MAIVAAPFVDSEALNASSHAIHQRVSLNSVIRAAVIVADGAALTFAAQLTGRPAGWVVLLATALALLASVPLRIRPSVTEEFGSVVWRVALAATVAGLASTHSSGLLRTALLAAGLIPTARLLPYSVLRWSRAHEQGLEPTVVVGTGPVARHLATTLCEHHEFGFKPVGFVDRDSDEPMPLPLLGDIDHLGDAIAETHATKVILAYGAHRDHELADALRETRSLPIDVFYVPRFFELGVVEDSRTAEDVWGVPLVRLGRLAMRNVAWRAKRAFDVVTASLLVAASLPALLLIALAVRLTSAGPALFAQERVGKDGRRIRVLKFRTMQVNDDSDTTWSVVEDDRRTRVGAFLRKTNLDELPQLLNVVRGDMSIVGPRPERPYFVEQFSAEIPGYDLRHRVPAGITGLSQVHGLRGDTSIPDRIRLDNRYIDAWSVKREAVILAQTLRTFVSRTAR